MVRFKFAGQTASPTESEHGESSSDCVRDENVTNANDEEMQASIGEVSIPHALTDAGPSLSLSDTSSLRQDGSDTIHEDEMQVDDDDKDRSQSQGKRAKSPPPLPRFHSMRELTIEQS